jgi:hypothetical protein
MLDAPNPVVQKIRDLAALPPESRCTITRVPRPNLTPAGMYEFSLFKGKTLVQTVCLSFAAPEGVNEVLREVDSELERMRESALKPKAVRFRPKRKKPELNPRMAVPAVEECTAVEVPSIAIGPNDGVLEESLERVAGLRQAEDPNCQDPEPEDFNLGICDFGSWREFPKASSWATLLEFPLRCL